MSSLDDGFGPVVAPATSPLLMRTDRWGDVLAVGASAERRPFFELASKLLPCSKLRTEEHRPIVHPMPPRCRRRRVVSALVAPKMLLWGGWFSPDLSHKKCHLHFKSALTNSSLPSLPSVLTSFPPPLSTSQIAAGARTRRRSSCLGLVRGRGRRTE